MEAARWHLPHAQLKNGNPEAAKKQLGDIAGDGGSPWQAEAAALLETLR